MTRCARCDWHSTPDDGPEHDQLLDHAQASSHFLCGCCGNSLREDEPRVCEGCLTLARTHLAGIVTLYDELPSHLGHARAAVYDSDIKGAEDGHPLPGGDVLVLLSGGSQGLAEDEWTTKDGDPVSVPFTLTWWSKAWREDRNDPDLTRPGSLRSETHAAAAYLEVHARWAANTHPGFEQFATDLRDLHRALEQATGRLRHPTKANADCFDCGGPLVRRIDDNGLEEDHWTCSHCRERYDAARYFLALKAAAEDAPLPEWSAPEHVVAKLGIKAATLRKWIERGHVRTKMVDGKTRVLTEDVQGRVAA